MVNTELLHAVLAKIEEEAAKPKTESAWRQNDWRSPGEWTNRTCDTAFCFAGWVPELLDRDYVSNDPDNSGYLQIRLRRDEEGFQSPWCAGEPLAHVSDFAKGALGLTQAQADWLFRGINTLDDLRRIVSRICEDPDHAPDDNDA